MGTEEDIMIDYNEDSSVLVYEQQTKIDKVKDIVFGNGDFDDSIFKELEKVLGTPLSSDFE
ncbi:MULTISPECIES: hypothetical protein [Bacillaceae]|uniref:Uncharacterized protein n=1 Tax=Domibacillus aminovorans TaxID=29332 RepID=A0A177L0S1_9BACI|nr:MULTISPECIES: hypothetical protein [Bacillaceae]OAH59270.1 hypothetical protein AWH48_16150 [Domibacillus aminovorans]